MDPSTITFWILGGAVVLFVSNRLPVAVVALCVPLSLWATGVLDLDDALAGFSSPTVVFIAGTFVVAEALAATGVTTWVGQQLLAHAGEGRTRLLVLMMLTCALVTAVITPNASVAALIPAVVLVSVRGRVAASQLLIPLAFAAHSGALLALTGSPVNVLVSEAVAETGEGQLGFFEFAVAGLPLLAGTVVITALIGHRVLPTCSTRTAPTDFGDLAATLLREYELPEDSGTLFDRHRGTAEVLIPPRSPLIGRVVFPGMVTESGDLVILAVRRGGEVIGTKAELAAGDVVVAQGAWEALSKHLTRADVVPVADVDAVRRQVVPLGLGAKEATAVLVVMVVLLATGAVPAAVASLLAAMSMVVLRILTIDHAYRAVSWSAVILVAGMIPLSSAMKSTGAAEVLAELLIDLVGGRGGRTLLLGVFVLVALLAQFISNTATALIVIPVALSAAVDLSVPPETVLMVVNMAATAAFLTPIATPANMMIMEPGGYRFGDYARLGLPLLLWSGVISVLWVPLVWGL